MHGMLPTAPSCTAPSATKRPWSPCRTCLRPRRSATKYAAIPSGFVRVRDETDFLDAGAVLPGRRFRGNRQDPGRGADRGLAAGSDLAGAEWRLQKAFGV